MQHVLPKYPDIAEYAAELVDACDQALDCFAVEGSTRTSGTWPWDNNKDINQRSAVSVG
jgi:hypothetical protein